MISAEELDRRAAGVMRGVRDRVDITFPPDDIRHYKVLAALLAQMLVASEIQDAEQKEKIAALKRRIATMVLVRRLP